MAINTLIVLATAAILLSPGPLAAHHSAAAYDSGKPVTITGTMTEFQFVNPHVIIRLEAKDEKGSVQIWQGELTSPNHLARAGWNPTIIKPGDQMSLSGFPAKNGSYSLRITKVVLKGEVLETGQD
jgi:hypothetical protein